MAKMVPIPSTGLLTERDFGTAPILEATHLGIEFGGLKAVDDFNITVGRTEIAGLIGPNGAGKSTTMNIMTGYLGATEGEVLINGHDITKEPEEAKKCIGYLPELPPLYLDRTPREYLTFVARAKGIPEREIPAQLSHAMAVTQILDVADRLIKNLSKGYKQRVGIAQAILGDPEIIILDEPTVGLDPRQIIEIRDLIKELGKNHTVILSSHILSEVQAVCQTILIISQGKLVACDSPENLERLFAGTTTIELVAEAGEDEVRKILKNVSGILQITVKSTEDGCCTVRLDMRRQADNRACREIFFAFSKANRAILQMSMAKASLEDIFMELTGNENQEGVQ